MLIPPKYCKWTSGKTAFLINRIPGNIMSTITLAWLCNIILFCQLIAGDVFKLIKTRQCIHICLIKEFWYNLKEYLRSFLSLANIKIKKILFRVPKFFVFGTWRSLWWGGGRPLLPPSSERTRADSLKVHQGRFTLLKLPNKNAIYQRGLTKIERSSEWIMRGCYLRYMLFLQLLKQILTGSTPQESQKVLLLR